LDVKTQVSDALFKRENALCGIAAKKRRFLAFLGGNAHAFSNFFFL